MKLAKIISTIAALTIATAIPAQAANAKTVEFNWRGETFVLTVPQDYCVPEGQWAERARANAAGDSQNETVINLERCGTFGQDYILIKTPRDLPPIDLPRSQFIDLVAGQFSDEVLQQGFEQGSRDVSKMSNGETSVDQRDYGFAGTDADCAYLAGNMTLNSPEGALNVRVGSCLTLVGTRNFAIHVYDNRQGGASVATLKQRSRQVAVALRRK